MPRYPEHPYDEYVRHTRQLDPVNDSDWRRRELVEDEVFFFELPDGRAFRVVPVEELEDEAA